MRETPAHIPAFANPAGDGSGRNWFSRSGYAARPAAARVQEAAGLAAVAVAALANWYALTCEIPVSPMPPPAVGEAMPPEFPGAPLTDAGTTAPAMFAEMLARPLFRASRRPAEAQAAKPGDATAGVQEPAPDLPSGLQLAGIVQGGGMPGRALIRSPEAPSGNWVEAGYELEGWRLTEIGGQDIVFEAGAQRRTLALFRAGAQ